MSFIKWLNVFCEVYFVYNLTTYNKPFSWSLSNSSLSTKTKVHTSTLRNHRQSGSSQLAHEGQPRKTHRHRHRSRKVQNWQKLHPQQSTPQSEFWFLSRTYHQCLHQRSMGMAWTHPKSQWSYDPVHGNGYWRSWISRIGRANWYKNLFDGYAAFFIFHLQQCGKYWWEGCTKFESYH